MASIEWQQQTFKNTTENGSEDVSGWVGGWPVRHPGGAAAVAISLDSDASGLRAATHAR